MALNGSSFIENYKKKLSVENTESINEAIYYAFKLTDIYGINKINKALFEASIKFNIDEEVLTNNIDNFFEGELNERKE